MYIAILAISVLVFVAVGVAYLRHPAASAFHPATFYLAFHGLVFVIRPLFGWYYGYDNMYEAIAFRPTEWHKTLALIITNVSFVVFMAVALRVAREPLTFTDEEGDAAERSRLLRRFWLIAIPLAAVGVYSLLWQWNELAAGREFLPDSNDPDGATKLVGVSGAFIAAAHLLAPVTVIIAWLGRFRWWSLLPFAGYSVLRLGTGSRTDFVLASVMLGLLLLFHLKRRWPGPLLIVAALGVAVVFDGLQESRGAIIRETLRPDVVDLGERWRPEEAPLETMDLALMEFIEFMVWAVPERTGTYDYFVNNLQLFTEPIPRAIWPDKPVGPPIRRFILHPPGTYAIGETFSLAGMGWFNAGLPGVVIWSALFALIYALPYRWLVRRRRSNFEVMGYAMVLSTCVLVFRDGSLVMFARMTVLYLLPLALLAVVARSRLGARAGA